jgi:hypothetical protein
MSLRGKRILRSVLLIGIVCGLLLCGAPHHALHADEGGAACFTCGLAGLEAPPALDSGGPIPFVHLPVAELRERAPRAASLRVRSSRAPPARV